jgi:hypothetical protein
MRQGSHSREEIRNHLLPFFESLVDEVHRARQEEATMQSEATIAKRGDELAAEAIDQWLLSFDRDDKHIIINGERYYRLSGPVEKTYSTSRGKARISRHLYRRCGVHTRMKRSGQRWKVDGGQAVLTLRSLATDARWEQAMNVLMPTFKRPVESVDQAA